MGRKSRHSILNVFMNQVPVGRLIRKPAGSLEFTYDDDWQNSEIGRPISLSMPIFQKKYSGTIVENFFDNLLPDSRQIRDRIQARFSIRSGSSFDLLSYIGHDCVGALQIIPEGIDPANVKKIDAIRVNDKQIENILLNYKTMPLGLDPEDEFRISIAGAQEKTALLWYKNKWHRPGGTTPTTHIIKLPIGTIEQSGIDLSDSVENEWLSHLIIKEFGLPIANCKIEYFNSSKALVVERFDRKMSEDKSWIIRLPQEDICQALGISPGIKYESNGGPGIKEILYLLNGSSESIRDKRAFMKANFIFWLIGAIDGHGKNFGIFLLPQSKFKLTPLYDVISAYPLIAKNQLSKQKITMAMGVRGKSKQYKWNKIKYRHWISTAERYYFPVDTMKEIISETISQAEMVLGKVSSSIPKNFPEDISGPVFDNIIKLKKEIEKDL